MTQLSQVKQNIQKQTEKSFNLKYVKDILKAQPGCDKLFLSTVPIEEVTRCQYKTVLIIFPLTIGITLDFVKWRKETRRETLLIVGNSTTNVLTSLHCQTEATSVRR